MMPGDVTVISPFLYLRSGNDFHVCSDSSLGTATHYGLDGPGIESRWGKKFPYPSRPALKSTQPAIKWVQRVFSWGKAAGARR
jgi:hypothetical protein